MGWKLLTQDGELGGLAIEVVAEAAAKDRLLRRGRGGHLVEKTLEGCAEGLG